jgi:glucans biosynthesis protein C
MDPRNHLPGERHDFLDWLRVLAILLLLFFHTGMLFVGWGWHITNEQTIDGLQLPMDLAHRLRMPLLFVIAGAGMCYALRRRSAPGLLRERTLRLLLPAVAGMFLIVPPQIFVERVVNGDWHGGYFQFWRERVLQFQPYPQGDFSWHHLWFIVYLFVYVLLLLPLMAWWRRAQPQIRPGVWLFALGLLLGINEALLKPHFPESHDLIGDWYIFNHYLMMTWFGFVMASMRGTWDWIAAHRRWALGAGLAVLLGGLTLIETGILERGTPADAVLANLFTWTWLLVFLGYGRAYLSFSNRTLAWARDASYPVYILHQTVIILIAWVVIRQPWHPWAKYTLVLFATGIVCALLYQLVVRRLAITRLLFGMKGARAGPGPQLSSRTAAS